MDCLLREQHSFRTKKPDVRNTETPVKKINLASFSHLVSIFFTDL